MKYIEKHRMAGLDTVKIVCALLIFMRHSITMYGCSYDFADLPVNALVQSLTGPVMSTFFIVSGFSLYYSYCDKPELNTNDTKRFYFSRLLTILPAYLAIHILWLAVNTNAWKSWLVLTPFEVSGLQSAYYNIFGVLHNGGTWFISCLLMAYFTFPIFRNFMMRISNKRNAAFILLLIMAGLVYLVIVSTHYQMGSNYSNPIFRIFEFVFGMAIMIFALHLKNSIGRSGKLVLLIVTSLLLFLFLMTLKNDGYIFVRSILKSTLAMYPAILLVMMSCYLIRIRKAENSRLLNYVSSLTYYFYILQLVLWNITDKVIGLFGIKSGIVWNNNTAKIAISFFICIICSILMKELVDRPIKKFIRKRMDHSENSCYG